MLEVGFSWVYLGPSLGIPWNPETPLNGLTCLRDVSPTKSETFQSPKTKGLRVSVSPRVISSRISFLPIHYFRPCNGDFLKEYKVGLATVDKPGYNPYNGIGGKKKTYFSKGAPCHSTYN